MMFFLFSSPLFSTPSLAQPSLALSASTTDFSEDETQDWSEDEEPDRAFEDALMGEEMELSAAERREAAPSMFLVSFGESYPWLQLGLEAQQSLSDDVSIGLFGGQGKREEFGKRFNDNYSVDFRSKSESFGVVFSKFISDFVPLALRCSLSFTQWRGSATPHSAKDEEDESLSADEDLPASFSAAGFNLGTAIAFQKQWTSGFTLEWTPVGLRKAWLVSQSTSRKGQLGSAVNRSLTKMEIYGFVNLKLGWAF